MTSKINTVIDSVNADGSVRRYREVKVNAAPKKKKKPLKLKFDKPAKEEKQS